jgi:6-phosphogluconate dehydrogenase (decarboxylating)
MQIGMIGLGRMGTNMVRRLQRGGHQCVVFDKNQDNVRDLGKVRCDRIHVTRGFRGQTKASARGVADGARSGGR